MTMPIELAHALLLAVLAQHEEQYDADCEVHDGCSCGWTRSGEEPTRALWQEHLVSVILGEKEK